NVASQLPFVVYYNGHPPDENVGLVVMSADPEDNSLGTPASSTLSVDVSRETATQ
ncbi:unnamed protein product, partial [Amoebophrya sp. A120]